MAKVLTRMQRIEVAEQPAPPREKKLLGWWRNVHCGSAYELQWLKGALCMRRGPGGEPFIKTAEEFEHLLGFGSFVRLPHGPL